jgi:hypothetical protein
VEVRTHDKNGPVVTTVQDVLHQVHEQLRQQQTQWLDQLRHQPGSLADLETQIHQTFQQVADQVVAGLLAQATAAEEFAQDAQKNS